MMYKKKLFGICCIFLLITIAILPNIYGIKIKKQSSPDIIKNSKEERKIYLGIKFSKLEYDTLEIDKEKTYAIYNAEYSVKNFGDFVYTAPCFILSRVNDPTARIVYSWYPNRFDLLMLHGMEKTFSHKVKILSNEVKYYDNHDKDDLEDDERFFAGDNIILTMAGLERVSGPYPHNPDSNIRYAKYWNDRPDYTPTLAHLLVSTPWRYEKKYIDTKCDKFYYPYVVINEKLPTVLTNQRLGWINEFNLHLKEICNDIDLVFSNESEEFVIHAGYTLKDLNQWIFNVCDWFKKLINETCDFPSLLDIFNHSERVFNSSVLLLKNVSIRHFGMVTPEVLELINDTREMVKWIDEKPWEKQITVKGSIKNVRRGETISISCRGKTVTLKDEDDGRRDRVVDYEFMVSSEPINNEDSYFTPHNCRIKVRGDRHLKDLSSVDVLSYCFSNGTFVKNFDIRDWGLIKKPHGSNVESNNILSFFK